MGTKWKGLAAAAAVLLLVATVAFLARPEFLAGGRADSYSGGPGGITATLPEGAEASGGNSLRASVSAATQTATPTNSKIVQDSYMMAFGRLPSADEEKWWVDILVRDSRFRNVDVLVYNHREYMKIAPSMRSETAMRAIKAVLGGSTIPSYYLDQLTQPGHLIYPEMMTRVILMESYVRSFGRYPTAQEIEAQIAARSPALATLDGMLQHLREELKSNQTTRQTVIKLAFQNVMSRQPSAHELSYWDAEVRQNGWNYSDLTGKVKSTPAAPQPAPPQPRPALKPPAEFEIYTPFTTQTRPTWVQDDSAAQGFLVQARKAGQSAWTTLTDRKADRGYGGSYGYQHNHQEGEAFSYRVCAYAGSEQACTPEKAAPGAAKAPTFRASAATKTSITLELRQVGTDAKELRLYRQEGPNPRLLQSFQATRGEGGVYTYTHTGLQANTVYTYRACGWNDRGEVCTNWTMAATNPADDPPVAPTGLQVTSTSANEISLAFTQKGTGMSELWLQAWDGSKWVTVKQWSPSADGARFTYTDTGLQTGATRYYTACAYNSRGFACAETVSGQTKAGARAPSITDVAVLNANSWRFTWAPTSQALELQFRADNETKWSRNTTINGSTGRFDWTLLQMNTPIYHVRLCLRDTQTCSEQVPIGRQWDHVSNFTSLDYGIYWVKCGTCRPDGKQLALKADPRLGANYFDPSKPTVIYVHGWQKDTVQKAERESFRSLYTYAAADVHLQDLSKAWKDRGYNVGIFYWNQFADDDWGLEPRDTERKIWENGTASWKVHVSKDKWEWGNNNEKLHKTAPQLFFDSYMAAMEAYKGKPEQEVRIVGHSLGHQMAVLLTQQLADAKVSAALMPDRVALLDAAYHDYHKADTVLSYIQGLKRDHKIVFEQYDSSWWARYGDKLRSGVIYTRIYADHDKNIFHGAHYAAINWYFQSRQYSPAAYEGWAFGQIDQKKQVGYAPSAGMGTEDLRKLESCNCVFEQWGDGKSTPSALDDIFGRWPR